MATPALLRKNNSAAPETIRAKAHGSPLWLHALLFVLTFVTTDIIGMRYMYNFSRGQPALAGNTDLFPYVWVLHHLDRFASGLPFSITLLAILLTHEFGHYFGCRHFKVKATLPYLLPAPTLSGTCGAVIRLKSSIRSRSALIVIAASGPIAGFVLAALMATVGLLLSKPIGATPNVSMIQFNAPLIVILLHSLLVHLHYSTPGALNPHPIFIASWIGILITSLNLVPAGQLDGGHMLYAVSPRVHRWCTRAIIAALLILGIFYWIGWLLWAALLMTPSMRHPKVPVGQTVARWQLALIPICLVILILSGTIRPFAGVSLPEIIHQAHW